MLLTVAFGDRSEARATAPQIGRFSPCVERSRLQNYQLLRN
ncbi:hypothetical protein BN903_64 [Halorubrum sp. AJ67]|nr:hypothetical protein BN903_64 [Halorubrum sp. AJ67]